MSEGLASKYEIKTLGEYQRSMDRYERFNDAYILPDVRLIIRLDGRRHGAGWSELGKGAYPFHPTIVSGLIGTAKRLMCIGLRVQFAFIHGDEISLVLDLSESAGQRRRAKLLSILASAATAGFMSETGLSLLFHNKLAELPTEKHLLDYFFWQRKVAKRNYFSHWLIDYYSEKGLEPKEIDSITGKLNEDERAELAYELGLDPKDVRADQVFGSAVWWQGAGFVETRDLSFSDEQYLTFLRDRFSGPAIAPELPYEELGSINFKKLKKLSAQSTEKPREKVLSNAPFRLGGNGKQGTARTRK